MLTQDQVAEIQREVSRILEQYDLRETSRQGDAGFVDIPAASRDKVHVIAGMGHVIREAYSLREMAGVTLAQSRQNLQPLVRVIARAVEVLGTSEKALRWINTPIRSLGDQAPVSLLNTPEGLVRVEDALGRIEHGVW